jgi:pimeloyl-ACP methyl ester carboxylesterase
MPWLFSKSFRKKHPERVQKIKAKYTSMYLSRSSEAFRRQMKANTEHNTKGSLDRIEIPTLIMVGKDDELTPPIMAEALKSEITNAELLVFEQGGHGLYWEIPELFNEAIVDFLNRQ